MPRLTTTEQRWTLIRDHDHRCAQTAMNCLYTVRDTDTAAGAGKVGGPQRGVEWGEWGGRGGGEAVVLTDFGGLLDMHPLAIILQQELVAAWGILEGNAVDGPGAKHSHSSCCLHSSHHITSHHITSHHITSHHITSHHITSHHITSQILIHSVLHATSYTA